MRPPALYSKSSPPPAPTEAQAADTEVPNKAPPPSQLRAARWRSRAGRTALVCAFLTAFAWLAHLSLQPAPPALTQKDIDRAVLHTLSTKELPSQAARAAEIVAPSVVRVVGYGPAKRAGRDAPARERPRPATPGRDDDNDPQGVGTGVVIVDNGTILTSLHVVANADRVKVIFADGTESVADVINVQPENDLAALKARKIPDDLVPATLRSTGGLRPGDEVVAVGYPFGIGPSASSGVISGLGREFRSPEGKRVLTNLIQFDAAANPGNSGGPLVTMDGSVVGIVAAILNPNGRTFAGIGFAVPIENAASAAGMSPF